MKRFFATTLLTLALAPAAFADDVLVYVNGKPITAKQVDEQMKAAPAALVGGREKEVRQALLERLIEEQLLLQQADKLKVENMPEYKEQLDHLVKNLKYSMVLKKALDAGLTEKAVKDFYEKNKARFAYPAIRASHILVADKATAEKVRKDLGKNGDFAEAAKANSTGPTGPNGGDLGWFGKGSMVPAFEEVAFSLNVGEISQPVQTQFGWHLIKVVEKDDKRAPSFSEVETSIRDELSRQVLTTYMEGLRKDADIKQIEN